MAIQNTVLATTLQAYAKTIEDQTFRKSPLLDTIIKLKKLKKEGGGQSLVKPVSLADHSSIVDLSGTGSEPVSLIFSNTKDRAIYEWSHSAVPVGITHKDKVENQGPQKVIDLMSAQVEESYNQLVRGLNQRIVANGSAATFGFSNLTTLAGSTSGGGSTTGIFEGKAFGSQVNTVGGISKSANAAYWQHQFADVADDFSANGYNKMTKLFNDCIQFGRGAPHVVLMSELAYQNFAEYVGSLTRFVDQSKVASVGYDGFTFKGALVVHEPSLLPSATADEEVSAYALNLDQIQLNYIDGQWFEVSDWQSLLAAGIAAEGCLITTSCQLAAAHLASSGILVDGDTA